MHVLPTVEQPSALDVAVGVLLLNGHRASLLCNGVVRILNNNNIIIIMTST